MKTTAVGVVVPPLLSLLLRRHRIGEIDPDTVASLLIHLLWDRLDSGRYRGPPLVQVLRRHHRSDRLRARDLANLALIDLECHTLLTLCQPPPGKPLGAVHLDELDMLRLQNGQHALFRSTCPRVESTCFRFPSANGLSHFPRQSKCTGLWQHAV